MWEIGSLNRLYQHHCYLHWNVEIFLCKYFYANKCNYNTKIYLYVSSLKSLSIYTLVGTNFQLKFFLQVNKILQTLLIWKKYILTCSGPSQVEADHRSSKEKSVSTWAGGMRRETCCSRLGCCITNWPRNFAWVVMSITSRPESSRDILVTLENKH